MVHRCPGNFQRLPGIARDGPQTRLVGAASAGFDDVHPAVTFTISKVCVPNVAVTILSNTLPVLWGQGAAALDERAKVSIDDRDAIGGNA